MADRRLALPRCEDSHGSRGPGVGVADEGRELVRHDARPIAERRVEHVEDEARGVCERRRALRRVGFEALALGRRTGVEHQEDAGDHEDADREDDGAAKSELHQRTQS